MLPEFPDSFTDIGTRKLNECGRQAIIDLFGKIK